MAYQSIVMQAANSALNNRQSMIKQEDDLKNSASTRDYQAASAAAASTNAMANVMQANTQRQAASDEVSLKRAALSQDKLNSEREYGLNTRAMNLKEAAFGLEQKKLEPELEHLQLQNDMDRINYSAGLLDFKMKEAMHQGNMERIPKLFALQDALMDAKMGQTKTEIGLQKWGLLSRYASGISAALDGNRPQDADVLYKAMLQDAKDMNVDLSKVPFLQAAPTTDNKQTWSMFKDVALNSMDVQQKIMVEQAQGGGSTALSVLKMLHQFGKDQTNEQRAKEDQSAQNISNVNKLVGTKINTVLGVATNAEGNPNPTKAAKEVDMYENTRSVVKSFILDENGNFRQGQNAVTAERLASEVAKRIKPVDVGNWSTEDNLGKFALQSTGVLTDPTGKILFQDPGEEISAIADDKRFNSEIIPGLINTAERLPGIAPAIQALTNELKSAPTGLARAREFEQFVLFLAAKEAQGH